jgi:hypothetical protein
VYGTIARLKVSRDNLEKLRELSEEQMTRNVPGSRAAHVLVPDERDDEAYLVVFFEDKASYQRNADNPSQHEDYLKMRALLDADPEWIDGGGRGRCPARRRPGARPSARGGSLNVGSRRLQEAIGRG